MITRRNTPEENKKSKEGEGGDLWNENQNKKKHENIDVRWTKKGGKSYFGYKNHVKVDVKSKLIDTYIVTDASIHDSQALEELLKESDKKQELYADSAYTGKSQEIIIAEAGMVNCVCEKGNRGNSLTDGQSKQPMQVYDSLASRARFRIYGAEHARNKV